MTRRDARVAAGTASGLVLGVCVVAGWGWPRVAAVIWWAASVTWLAMLVAGVVHAELAIRRAARFATHADQAVALTRHPSARRWGPGPVPVEDRDDWGTR